MLKRFHSVLFVLVVCAGCSEFRDSHELLHSVLWMQTSAEYHTITTVTYQRAAETLDLALRDKTWTAALEQAGHFQDLPPAVILDLDETVLDNGPFEGRLVKDRTTFNVSKWDQWIREANAQALPGAVEFITEARSKGITVFFVANRQARHESWTRKNLEQLGIPLPAAIDTVLLQGEEPHHWGLDKSSRRRYVADRYRVLLIIGDDLGDFLPGARDVPDNRLRQAQQQRNRWGVSWFLLPNPIYGSWEASLYPDGLSDADILKAKRNLVREMP
ncbi:MAG: hypothetical protein HY348_05485 [Nitrospira defluvii]|nr:hypothetical protein [Nitrospira defluvii]